MKANYYSYHVTRDGRVFNKWGAEMCPSNNGRGYKILSLTTAPYTQITKAVHRLVAEVYIPNPYKLSDVDHIDCDKHHNDVSNLRWLSHGDNIQHSYDAGRRSAVGESNARSIMTNLEVRDICTLLSEGYRSWQVRDMGYPYNIVRAIEAKKNWAHISCDYKF